MTKHQQHKHIIQEEFSRQADQIISAPSFTDFDTIDSIVKAAGATYQDRVLDVACGTGVVVFSLAKTAKEVIGLDLTGEMLQKARKQRHEQGIANVHFELGEAEALPFEDGAFDVTVCRMSVHHFSEPAKSMAEMARVTRPGGRVVIADIVSSSDIPTTALHNAIERLRDPSHVRMLTDEELIGLVTSSGLRITSTESWGKSRNFEEWAEVLNAPARTEPLGIILTELARANVGAGMDLRLDDAGKLHFTHQWLMVVAERPKA